MHIYLRTPCASRWLQNNDECGVGLQVKPDADKYSLAMNVLGIVAVLIANITYLGYITPPGGTHPSWEGCDYDASIALFF